MFLRCLIIYFQSLSPSGWTIIFAQKKPEQNNEKVKIVGSSEEIQTGYFPNTSSEPYRYAALFCLQLFAIFCEHAVKAPHDTLPQN
jgi:hypothetical protein